MTTAIRRTTYREVFAEPVFRTLFATRALAIVADTLRIVALSLLVFASTGSALLGAVAFGVGFLPQAIGGTLLASLADRMPPRGLIVGGYLMECAVAASLGLIDLPVATSLGLVAVVAALTPVFSGASSRLVADRLVGDAYVVGRSVSSVASAAAQLVGLAAGGLAVGALGPHRALLVSAAGHAIAALGVRARLPRLNRPAVGKGSAVAQSWSTTNALLADPAIRRLLLIQWLPPAFATGTEALLIPYAASRGYANATAGLLLAAVPLGMLVSGVIVGRLVRPAGRERLVAPLVLLLGVAILGLALPVPLMVALGLLFLLGCGFAYSLGVQRPFLKALPDAHRGQAFALLGTGVMTLQGLGPVLFGAIGQYRSIGTALVACGLATTITAALWWRRGRGPVITRTACTDDRRRVEPTVTRRTVHHGLSDPSVGEQQRDDAEHAERHVDELPPERNAPERPANQSQRDHPTQAIRASGAASQPACRTRTSSEVSAWPEKPAPDRRR